MQQRASQHSPRSAPQCGQGVDASLTVLENAALGCGSMAEIRAEITASVWKVVVDEGQAVAEGDEIAILESMKMESAVSENSFPQRESPPVTWPMPTMFDWPERI